MTSYHDLEEQVYKGIRSKPFTRIHGTVDWRKKEILKTEASNVGFECQVSHNWAGGLGLTVEIIGATRYAAENPTFFAVRRADSTSQQPIVTSQPNSSVDTHTHG